MSLHRVIKNVLRGLALVVFMSKFSDEYCEHSLRVCQRITLSLSESIPARIQFEATLSAFRPLILIFAE